MQIFYEFFNKINEWRGAGFEMAYAVAGGGYRGVDWSIQAKNVETCLHVVAIKHERFECVRNRIKIRENIIYLHVFRSEEKEGLPLCFFEQMRCEAVPINKGLRLRIGY